MSGRKSGFTLAEVLIALALLGVVATFVIPKLLQSTNNEQRLAASIEARGILSQAFDLARSENNGTVSGSTSFADIMSHVNYTAIKTTGEIDHFPNTGYGPLADCSTPMGFTCYQMPGGGVFLVNRSTQFGKTLAAATPNTNRGMLILFDPDGTRNNVPSIGFVLYSDGQLKTARYTLPNTGFESAVGGPLVEVGIPAGALLNTNGTCSGLCDPDWYHL